eukprot:TRINITY_DN3727_c0_g1_i1.p1 TRINITY_DN3727_c0_g1~~TRINITY_DN3727_c0_g1_i1.p1  ORF type:complete len:440 (-),score=123.68 TRINITY_DN3727_c0_g1_i1:90-1409(-)
MALNISARLFGFRFTRPGFSAVRRFASGAGEKLPLENEEEDLSHLKLSTQDFSKNNLKNLIEDDETAELFLQKLPGLREELERRVKNEPFPGYEEQIRQAVIGRGRGPSFPHLPKAPLQPRKMSSLPRGCPLCLRHPISGAVPIFNAITETNVDMLAKYVGGDGGIMPRKKTGVCAKHQRKLAQAIKRARHLGFLSHTRGPDDFFNRGGASTREEWLEWGDFLEPAYKRTARDEASRLAGRDERVDDNGRILRPSEFRGTQEIPEDFPVTFHLTHQAYANVLPVAPLKSTFVKGSGNPPVVVADHVKHQQMLADHQAFIAEAPENPFDTYNNGEVYISEAELMGKPLPGWLRPDLQQEKKIIADILRTVRARKLLKQQQEQAKTAPLATQPTPQTAEQRRRRALDKIAAQNRAKAAGLDVEDVDWDEVVDSLPKGSRQA